MLMPDRKNILGSPEGTVACTMAGTRPTTTTWRLSVPHVTDGIYVGLIREKILRNVLEEIPVRIIRKQRVY
jgi:hypothetical protein